MQFDSEDLGKVIEEFAISRKWLDGITLEVVGDLNPVDSLTLLRAYEGDVTVDVKLSLANAFCQGKLVRFIDASQQQIIKEVTCGPAGFAKEFPDDPWLLQVLLSGAYGWMVKKLTPPSVGSMTAAKQ